ncbi:MAG: SDR family oxidoreductase [Candidatus Binatia bacterium]
MTDFAGKTAIVTGAARGLGRDYARLFARDGANVVAADVNAEGANECAAEIGKADGRAIGVALDVRDPASAKAAVDAALARFGGADILVNNAAVWGDYESKSLLDVELEYWNLCLAVNLTGPLVCARAAIPAMQQKGWGRIINISSIGAWLPLSGVYGVSKLALHNVTMQLAALVGGSGITVNAVAPGVILNEATLKQAKRAQLDGMIAQSATKRAGTSEDLYGAIRWLASDDAAWVTGQVISPNGGFISRL